MRVPRSAVLKRSIYYTTCSWVACSECCYLWEKRLRDWWVGVCVCLCVYVSVCMCFFVGVGVCVCGWVCLLVLVSICDVSVGGLILHFTFLIRNLGPGIALQFIKIFPFWSPKSFLAVFWRISRQNRRNSENYHFVNHLCAYLRYNNIPELFTFLS